MYQYLAYINFISTLYNICHLSSETNCCINHPAKRWRHFLKWCQIRELIMDLVLQERNAPRIVIIMNVRIRTSHTCTFCAHMKPWPKLCWWGCQTLIYPIHAWSWRISYRDIYEKNLTIHIDRNAAFDLWDLWYHKQDNFQLTILNILCKYDICYPFLHNSDLTFSACKRKIRSWSIII